MYLIGSSSNFMPGSRLCQRCGQRVQGMLLDTPLIHLADDGGCCDGCGVAIPPAEWVELCQPKLEVT